MTRKRLEARKKQKEREMVSNRDTDIEDTDYLPITMVHMGKNLPTVFSASCTDMMSSSEAPRNCP